MLLLSRNSGNNSSIQKEAFKDIIFADQVSDSVELVLTKTNLPANSLVRPSKFIIYPEIPSLSTMRNVCGTHSPVNIPWHLMQQELLLKAKRKKERKTAWRNLFFVFCLSFKASTRLKFLGAASNPWPTTAPCCPHRSFVQFLRKSPFSAQDECFDNNGRSEGLRPRKSNL